MVVVDLYIAYTDFIFCDKKRANNKDIDNKVELKSTQVQP